MGRAWARWPSAASHCSNMAFLLTKNANPPRYSAFSRHLGLPMSSAHFLTAPNWPQPLCTPPRIAQARLLAERIFPPIARFSVDPHRPISEMADLGTKTAMQRHIMSSYRRTGALISLQGPFLLRISALYRPYSRIRSSTDPNGRPWL